MTPLRNVIAAAAMIGAAASPGHAADFNNDGKQDLLWRDHSGAAVVWQMNGLGVASRATLAPALDAYAAIVGSGNFFGAGTGAIAWVNSLNQLTLWRVAGGTVQQTCIAAAAIDPGWRVLGVGDVDGDGIDDVVWLAPGGSVRVYEMNGCSVVGSVTLGATAQATWKFLGIGSYDGNGTGELFWRATNGDVIQWRLHNGTGILSATLAGGSYAGWTVAAVADFDGDGVADLLFRNGTSGQTAVWLMNGSKATAVAVTPASDSVFAAADTIFAGGFDRPNSAAPPLDSNWTIIGTADTNGDGSADVVLADDAGNAAIWQMQGATIVASGFVPASGDMPYAALTGWRMMMDRPTVTLVDGQVTVAWQSVLGSPAYTVYASSTNLPATSGVAIAATGTTLAFGRNDAGYADKRYFAVSAGYLGVQLPPSREAYIVEFVPHLIPEWGAMAIADFNHDGCVDVLDALGDCHGNFTVLSETTMGLAALHANGRAYRDLRYADLDGDGIDDLISNVYTDDADTSSNVLFFRGTGNNHFVEDTAFTAMQIRGYGETVVVADFNNDGYLDIFLPQYSMDSPDDHSWLLINDGHGHFTDVSDLSGIAADPDANPALRAVPSNCRVEGAQAVDVNGDGRIDLYVASHLFLNQGADADGVPHFVDVGPRVEPSSFLPGTYSYYNCVVTTPSPAGLPLLHDEGAKFFDLDNSGMLTLLVDGAESSELGGDGVSVFELDGLGNFVDHSDVVPHFYMDSAWGIQAVDVDGDGLPDIVLAGGCDSSYVVTPQNPPCPVAGQPHVPPHLLVNRGGQFVQHDFYQDGVTPTSVTWFDAPAAADFDLSGTMDLALRSNSLVPFLNQATSADTIVVSVVGPNGEHNQAGRVVHVSPVIRPSVIMTQIVDGGSGYLANSQYDLTFATPYEGAYTVSVRFATATYVTTAHRGDHVTLRADGTYAVQ